MKAKIAAETQSRKSNPTKKARTPKIVRSNGRPVPSLQLLARAIDQALEVGYRADVSGLNDVVGEKINQACRLLTEVGDVLGFIYLGYDGPGVGDSDFDLGQPESWSDVTYDFEIEPVFSA